jgi:hypothetical protein
MASRTHAIACDLLHSGISLEVTHRTPSTRNTGEAAHHGDCFLREIIETLLA